ncbi:UNVERIFIED_ORG: hypothetical protein LHK14_24750 (plasmid) [Roseateles sp. XES5]|nr:hypothetical protein [Roseateles sp. XES5]
MTVLVIRLFAAGTKIVPRAFPAKSGSPEMLQLFVLTALSEAEAIPLRLDML